MPQRSGLDRLGLKVKEAQELTRFRVQCDPRTFAEKAKRDAVRCLRDRHQTSGSSEVWHMPRCAMSCPCTENCLTKRSSSGRTHREHERSFSSKGARWVSCRLLGEHCQVKHDVAPEKCALPQKLVLYPLACNREQGALSDDALAIVHLHCVLPSCFEAQGHAKG